VALPLLVRVGLGATWQVTGLVAAQVRLTVPVKPLTEATLRVSVPLLPAVTGTMVVLGISEKSESGLENGLPLLRVTAEGL